jgi:histidinol-phosphate phosphatase family protein
MFLDRDGTINAKASTGNYIEAAAEVELLPGAAAAIRDVNDRGLRSIVVTNQRGVALGRMSEAAVHQIHARLNELLATVAGAWIDLFLYCPHDIDECTCRKPDTGMFAAAKRRWPDLDFTRSAMVGDSPSDVEAGETLGMATVLLPRDAPDLAGAIRELLDAG